MWSLLRDVPQRQRYRVRARLGAILIAAIGAYVFALLIQERLYWWALLPALLLAIATIAEFIVTDILLDRRFQADSAALLKRLREKLDTTPIHNEIIDALNGCVRNFRGCDPSLVSSTLHLRVDVLADSGSDVVPSLIQVSDYTKRTLGGARWRVLDPALGLVGRCLRLDEVVWVNFRDRAEYDRRMVEEFGFAPGDVERHTTSARSYLAFPLRSDGRLVGILYFFSTEPQVFPVAAEIAELDRAGAEVLRLLRVAKVL